jgi:hypothetical protein
MKYVLVALMIIGLPFSLGIAAQDAQPTTSADEQPDATVQFEGGAFAAGIGWVWGHGTVNYQGSSHPFSISGMSIVDVGAASVSASGIVSHLTNLSDFAGNYTAFTAGATVGGGGSAMYFKNKHGVVIKLTSSNVGLRFNLAANGVTIKLEG